MAVTRLIRVDCVLSLRESMCFIGLLAEPVVKSLQHQFLCYVVPTRPFRIDWTSTSCDCQGIIKLLKVTSCVGIVLYNDAHQNTFDSALTFKLCYTYCFLHANGHFPIDIDDCDQ